jgi:hypothetical protein
MAARCLRMGRHALFAQLDRFLDPRLAAAFKDCLVLGDQRLGVGRVLRQLGIGDAFDLGVLAGLEQRRVFVGAGLRAQQHGEGTCGDGQG